jgi:hypothetical protein
MILHSVGCLRGASKEIKNGKTFGPPKTINKNFKKLQEQQIKSEQG